MALFVLRSTGGLWQSAIIAAGGDSTTVRVTTRGSVVPQLVNAVADSSNDRMRGSRASPFLDFGFDVNLSDDCLNLGLALAEFFMLDLQYADGFIALLDLQAQRLNP